VVGDAFARWRRGGFFFTSSTIVRRKELLAFDQPFPLHEKLGEDLDLWFRLAERTPFAWTPAIGTLYTVGNASSLTGAGGPADPLPAFDRLRKRAEAGGYLNAQRRDVMRLLATHWLNVARTRAISGDTSGACALLFDPVTRHRPVYWLRSAIIVAANGVVRRAGASGRS
jgi:hypothetical protein